MLLLYSFVQVKNKQIKLTQGGKPYTGRTVDPLNDMVSGHRHCYKEVLKQSGSQALQEIVEKNSDTVAPHYLDISLSRHYSFGPVKIDVFLKKLTSVSRHFNSTPRYLDINIMVP